MTISYPLNLGLGDSPDASLTPEVWQELNKLSLACKYIASSLSDGSSSGSNPAIVGIPGVNITLQNYSKIKRVASQLLPAGSVVEFYADSTVLTTPSYPYATGYTEDEVAAGAVGTFIMLGLVYYPADTLVPGSRYYTDLTIPGGITTAGGGRYVGQAFATNALYFDPYRS